MELQNSIELVFIAGTFTLLFFFCLVFFLILKLNHEKRKMFNQQTRVKLELRKELAEARDKYTLTVVNNKRFIDESLVVLMSLVQTVDKAKLIEKNVYDEWIDAVTNLYEKLNQEYAELTEAVWAELHEAETPLDRIILGYYEIQKKKASNGILELDVSTSIEAITAEAVYPILQTIQALAQSPKLIGVTVRSTTDGYIKISYSKPLPDAVDERISQIATAYDGLRKKNTIMFPLNTTVNNKVKGNASNTNVL